MSQFRLSKTKNKTKQKKIIQKNFVENQGHVRKSCSFIFTVFVYF